MFPFLVCQFGKGTLSNLVKERFGNDFPDIYGKDQINYIYNYLKNLKAESILLETDYVDKYYLKDYSSYYVRCFNRYGERCARLHFFKDLSSEKSETGKTEDKVFVEHTLFKTIFNGADEERQITIKKLQDQYLGFIVIKPIPETFIGRTCLKVHDGLSDSDTKITNGQKKMITKNYPVNLFGIDLEVESIPFQEQDKVLSACATTAVWSALHALNCVNNSEVPSPSEITLSAMNHNRSLSNSFPTIGLKNEQILRALGAINLRHHKLDIGNLNSDEYFFQMVRIYIDSGLPIILGAVAYKIKKGGGYEKLGGHAVTILGYNANNKQDRRLYLHDDRIGPFCRADIKKELHSYENNRQDIKETYFLELQEKNEKGEWHSKSEILVPESLIIPVYRKVRIHALYIKNTCFSIVKEYEAFVKKKRPSCGLENAVTYKIILEQLSAVRKRILGNSSIKNKQEILTKGTARFLWSAKFEFRQKLAFEILFDATDIPQGKVISNIMKYTITALHHLSTITVNPMILSKNLLT